MRIASLGYHPINQTNQKCKNNLQASPAFKGKIELIGPPEKCAELFGDLLVSFAEKLRAKGVRIFGIPLGLKRDGENLIPSFSFCRRYDQEGREVADEARKKFTDSGVVVNFTEGKCSL